MLSILLFHFLPHAGRIDSRDKAAAPSLIERTVAGPVSQQPVPAPAALPAPLPAPPPAAALAAAQQPAAQVVYAEEGPEDAPPPQNRQARRHTLWMFVRDPAEAAQAGVSIVDPYVLCRVGCKNKAVAGRHLRSFHGSLLESFNRCKNGLSNWNELEETIANFETDVLEKVKKARRLSDSFWKKVDRSVPGAMDRDAVAQLLLLLWAVSNGIPRFALNDPILDAYHRHVGASPPSNRHTLQAEYLPILDNLVIRGYVQRLKGVASVSLLADGWRDLVRRDWLDAGVQWVEETVKDSQTTWSLQVVHLDLIFVPTSATSAAIHDLIATSVDDFVRPRRQSLSLTLPSFHRTVCERQ